MKTEFINGVPFESVKVKNIERKKALIEMVEQYSTRSLYDCYANPSINKQAAYDMWQRWANTDKIIDFGVHSYNTFSFTLTALVGNHDETDLSFIVEGVIKITPTHNYYYKF